MAGKSRADRTTNFCALCQYIFNKKQKSYGERNRTGTARLLTHSHESLWQTMLSASFHRERVTARRLARSHALPPVLALQRVLRTAAGDMPLADFLEI